MKDIITSDLNNMENSIESAVVEKTIKYETDEGKVKEKTSVTYKADNGNVIDNTVNTIKGSESVQKATVSVKSGITTLIKLSITLGIIGFVLLLIGVMTGIIN